MGSYPWPSALELSMVSPGASRLIIFATTTTPKKSSRHRWGRWAARARTLGITGLVSLTALIQSPIALLAGDDAPPKLVELEKTPATFQEFIKTLRQAALQKNPHPIYHAISPTYKIERDFGGGFDPAANAIVNFSMSFPFDNADLRPEFKDHGWTVFGRRIAHNDFDETANGELCAPAGATKAEPLPNAQLCFGAGPEDQWRITRHINGGD